jgi:hypothetical protein
MVMSYATNSSYILQQPIMMQTRSTKRLIAA